MAAAASAVLPASLRVAPIHPAKKLSRQRCNWSQFGCGVAAKRRSAVRVEMSWVEFPKLSPAGKQLMETVADLIDQGLGQYLQPSQTAADVRSFKGASGEGSVTLRAGQEGSKVKAFLPNSLPK